MKQIIILLLLAYYTSVAIAFVYLPTRGNQTPYGINHTIGCSKIAGISQLPLTAANVCDTRGPCGIISDGALCVSTSLDRYFAAFAPEDFPILTCISPKCTAASPPKGMKGVLDCVPDVGYGTKCECPCGTVAAWSCGICGSPKSSTCFCCTGKD